MIVMFCPLPSERSEKSHLRRTRRQRSVDGFTRLETSSLRWTSPYISYFSANVLLHRSHHSSFSR